MRRKQIDRIRKICLALPASTERLSHGEPTFFAGKRVFCMFANNHHGDGRIAVWVPAPLGAQAVLIETSPDKFFRPPYVGGKGWVGIELKNVRDRELTAHIQTAWRLAAPKKIVAEFTE